MCFFRTIITDSIDASKLSLKFVKLGFSFDFTSLFTRDFDWYLDGPAVVSVNIFVRSISKIDDVTMVSLLGQAGPYSSLCLSMSFSINKQIAV